MRPSDLLHGKLVSYSPPAYSSPCGACACRLARSACIVSSAVPPGKPHLTAAPGAWSGRVSVTERETTAAISQAWPFYCAGLLRRSRGRRVGLPQPELVPVRVLAGREPAHGRNRCRGACLPAELIHTRRARFNVIDREVRPHTALARLHIRDRYALLAADLGRVVLERAGVRLELPPEQGAPESLALAGVVRRDLDVHDLAWQRCLLVSSFTAMPLSVPAPPGRVKLIGCHPDTGPSGYFRTRDRILRPRSRGILRPARIRAGQGAGPAV